jgi:predicted GH43/DUF377 family glycosyl hydrolase
MPVSASDELFRRHPSNPILTAAQWPYPCNTVFNPAATRVGPDTLLLARVEGRSGVSHLTAARSADGFTNWVVAPAPTLAPSPAHPEEQFGVEDARITFLAERQEYAVCYTAYSSRGPLVALALTRDFESFERVGAVLPPENKDAALFPERLGGRWAMLHRPVPGGGAAHIWLAFSPDLRHWGGHRLLLAARDGSHWDAGKVGANTPPIPTDEGWLLVYHGVKHTAAGCLYRLGLALLDRDDPCLVKRRTEEWVMAPREPYELQGDVGHVVFPCGHVLDGDELRLYYGAADSSIGVATASLREVVAHLLGFRAAG